MLLRRDSDIGHDSGNHCDVLRPDAPWGRATLASWEEGMAKVLVIGAGRSGLAAAAHLVRESNEVVLAESKAHPDARAVAELTALGVPAVWGPHPSCLLDGCSEVVLSPGVPP